MANPIDNPLPKGSYAFAHIQKSAYHMHTGAHHWSRFYVVRVAKADRQGRVKAFFDSPESAAAKGVRHATIYAIPPKYLDAAKVLYANQPIDFTGYLDKEHLRLALVNSEIAAA